MKFSQFLAALLVVSGAVQTLGAEMEIASSGEVAFREGKDEYRVGMDSKDFQKQFGPPEQTFDIGGGRQQLNYDKDGLIVVVSPKGKVVLFNFTIKADASGMAKAHAKTDKGIDADASIRQVVKAHGEPTKREDETVGGESFVNLIYKIADDHWLIFRFFDGEFARCFISDVPDPGK